MKLTKREKIMLYALVLVAIVAGMQMLVINPAMTASDTLDTSILEREQAIFSMQQTISAKAASQASYEESAQGIAEARQGFLPLMTNEELDRYITGALKDCHLVAESLTISSDLEQPSSGSVILFSVNVTARGSMTNFEKLVEFAKATPGIRIMGIQLVDDTPAATPTPVPTATPKPTRTPKKSKQSKATPTPELAATPTPEPADPSVYRMDITFAVAEYDPSAVADILPGQN